MKTKFKISTFLVLTGIVLSPLSVSAKWGEEGSENSGGGSRRAEREAEVQSRQIEREQRMTERQANREQKMEERQAKQSVN